MIKSSKDFMVWRDDAKKDNSRNVSLGKQITALADLSSQKRCVCLRVSAFTPALKVPSAAADLYPMLQQFRRMG
jgi:hypothetical protein